MKVLTETLNIWKSA